MRSPAYADFVVRLREAILLIRLAKGTLQSDVAAACSKSAAVLLAAALERYVNAALHHTCQQIRVTEWEKLSSGVQKFLCTQISRKLSSVIKEIDLSGDVTGKNERRLRQAIIQADAAFSDPSTWNNYPEFGAFMEGAAAPERLNAVLRNFHPDGEVLFETLGSRGQNRSWLGRSLTDLVDTRHAVAHAIPDRTDPSPNDVATWAVVTFIITRGIEEYLEFATR
jgi:hypothetical protein